MPHYSSAEKDVKYPCCVAGNVTASLCPVKHDGIMADWDYSSGRRGDVIICLKVSHVHSIDAVCLVYVCAAIVCMSELL